MGNDQRHRLGVRRTDVQKMDIEPVDPGRELGEAIEAGLSRPPVIFLGPIPADFLDPLQRRALAPVVDQFSFRPPRFPQPCLQIVKSIVPDRDAERLDFCAHGDSFGAGCQMRAAGNRLHGRVKSRGRGSLIQFEALVESRAAFRLITTAPGSPVFAQCWHPC